MQTFYYRVAAIIGLLLELILTGCRSIMPSPTVTIPTHYPSPVTILETPIPASTPTFSPTLGQADMRFFTVKIAKSKLAGYTHEKIAERLFTEYLSIFTTGQVEQHIRLKKFYVNFVDLDNYDQTCSKNWENTWMDTVHFAVQTVDYPAADWYVPDGNLVDDHWVTDKTWTIAVYPVADAYTFKLLGSPHCEGITIDGSPVP